MVRAALDKPKALFVSKLNLDLRMKPVNCYLPERNCCVSWLVSVFYPFEDKAQTVLFKDPVRTAL